MVTCKSCEVIYFQFTAKTDHTATSLVLTSSERAGLISSLKCCLQPFSHLRGYFALPAQQQMTEGFIYRYSVSHSPEGDHCEMHILQWCSEFPSKAQASIHHILRALQREDPFSCNFWKEARQGACDAGAAWQLESSERNIADKVLPLLACPVSISST